MLCSVYFDFENLDKTNSSSKWTVELNEQSQEKNYGLNLLIANGAIYGIVPRAHLQFFWGM